MYGQGKTRGKVALLRIHAAMNQACAAIEVGGQLDNRYLLHYLASQYEGIRLMSNAGSQENLSGELVRRIPILVPPIREQQAIAARLDDANDLITGLERIIAKKQAIKQGLMQMHFALPVDRKNMEPLGSIASFLSGGTPDRSNYDYWAGNIPWISAATLKHLEVSTSDQHVTPLAVKAGSRMAPLDSTLILVRGSALHSEIRASLVVTPVCFNQDIKALVPSPRLAPKFLTYSIHANADRLLRLVTSAGNTAGVLDTRVLKSLDFWIPDRGTQQRIVSMFDTIYSELDVLAAKAAKARAVKQGMMQQLLTGRIRLPSGEGNDD